MGSRKWTKEYGGAPLWMLVIAAVILAGVGIAWAVSLTQTTPEASRTYAPRPQPERTPLERLVIPDGASVLFLGDSYTEGWGSPDPAGSFAHQLAAARGWNATFDGIGSTGYMNPGQANQGTFAERALLAEGGPYDLIIVQGGSNDQRYGDVDLRPAIDATVTALRTKHPEAQIVLVGPVGIGVTPPDKARVDNQVEKYARENRIHYISPVKRAWFRSEDRELLIDEATGHPNTEGYLHMAEKLGEALDGRVDRDVYVD